MFCSDSTNWQCMSHVSRSGTVSNELIKLLNRTVEFRYKKMGRKECVMTSEFCEIFLVNVSNVG